MIELERKYAALLARTATQAPPEREAMRLCFEVLALAGAIDRDCAARLGPHGLSEGKFVLLFLLEQAGHGLSPRDLAERAGVTPGTVTGLLDGLERAGFVRRVPHEADRRSLVIRLTPDGRQLAESLVAEHGRWIGSLFSDLSAQERSLLSRLLARAFARTEAGSQTAGSGTS